MKIEAQKKNKWEQYILPIILVVLCFLDFNRGIDMSDTGYSATNFLFFHDLLGQRVFSTFISLLVGHGMVLLPYGDTLAGLSFYCTFILVALAWLGYFWMKERVDYRVVFISEVMALFLCWTPRVVLYDYLTFLLFNVCVILLYSGLEKDSWIRMILAGGVLGVNTFVRISNIAEVTLIVIVWIYGCFSYKEKGINKFNEKLLWQIKYTLICMAGWFIGAGLCMGIFMKAYHKDSVEAAIKQLTTISQGGSHSLSNIFTGPFYQIKPIYIPLAAIIAILLCSVLYSYLIRNKNKWFHKFGYMIFGTLMLLLYIYMYKKQIYSFVSTSYMSIFYVTMMVCIWGVGVSILNFFVQKEKEPRILAIIYIILLYITPLGSDTYSMLDLNNMYLMLPLIIYETNYFWRYLKEISRKRIEDGDKIWHISKILTVTSFIFISFLWTRFGVDYLYGASKPETIITEENPLKYMRTTSNKADSLNAIIEYYDESGSGQLIEMCNSPIFYYLLKAKPVLSNCWPELGSYQYSNMLSELETISNMGMKNHEYPEIIVSSTDVVGYQMFCNEPDLDDSSFNDIKKAALFRFMYNNNYEIILDTGEHAVYKVK
jgi:membrane protein